MVALLERDIQKKVNDYAKSKGILIKRFLERGDVDRLYVFPSGEVVFIEFKQAGKKPTALQALKLRELEMHNCKTKVVDSVEYGYEVVNAYL